MKYWLVFVLSCLTPEFCFSQDTTGVYKLIDRLSSVQMKGRGYAEKGDSIAAEFIKEKYLELGLQPFNDSYFQKFNHAVNTFPQPVFLSRNKLVLRPGIDFIVEASSITSSAEGKVILINKERSITLLRKLKKSKLKSSIVCFDTTGTDAEFKKEAIEFFKSPSSCRGILWTVTKLTWTIANHQSAIPRFYILKSCVLADQDLVSFSIKSEFIINYTSNNVKGYLVSKTKPDSFIFITAHYDHLGLMGDVLFPGANDNASGVSMLLKIAEYFAGLEDLPCSIVFICFAGEEAGLVGSEYYVKNTEIDLTKIKLLLNLDLVGNGEKGITVVNATEFPIVFNKIESLNNDHKYFQTLIKRGKAANSDHFHFSEKGVTSFFIYTLGGTGNYHDVGDIPSTLTLTGFRPLMKLIIDLINII